VGQTPPANAVPLIRQYILNGRIVRQSDMQEARERVLTWIRRSTEEKKEPGKKNGKNGTPKKSSTVPKA
jgi:hypothetical protein